MFEGWPREKKQPLPAGAAWYELELRAKRQTAQDLYTWALGLVVPVLVLEAWRDQTRKRR